MQKNGRQTRRRRAILIGVSALIVILGVLITLYPRGSRAPEYVAENFLTALLQTPQDTERLRAAARLDEGSDPQAVVEGLSTQIVLDFLRARTRQGAMYRIDVTESTQLAAQRYLVVLRVAESGSEDSLSSRRFNVTLQKTNNGDWQAALLAVVE